MDIRNHHLTTREVLLGIFTVGILVAVIVLVGGERKDVAGPAGDQPARQEVPAMTPLMKEVLEKSKGFQLLVSYTDKGFEPSNATIKRGDTVRFTNNSNEPLWVAAAGVEGGAVYPSVATQCGQSSFDTCTELQPHEFWEFTFEQAGVWGYKNFLENSHTAVIKAR